MLYYYQSKSLDVFRNIATEELLYKKRGMQSPILMLWQNSCSVVIGKHQNPWIEADVPFLEKNNIPVVRRISGGGTVYHDENNLNFSVIKNKGMREAFDLKEFTLPLHRLLQKLGCNSERGKRGDVRIDGYKICGTAQAQSNNRILYHGCILFDTDLGILHNALDSKVRSIKTSSVSSVRSKVTNISSATGGKISLDEFRKMLLDEFIDFYGDLEPISLTRDEEEEIYANSQVKFADWDWNFGATPKFSVKSGRPVAKDMTLEIVKGRVKTVEDDLMHPYIGRRFDPEFML